jgi:hypothetical protein
MLDELTTWYGDPNTQLKEGGVVAASAVRSHQPLLSGHVFHVWLDTKEDAEKMKDMVDLQWNLIVIASLAGAADPPKLSDDSDNDSNYGAMEIHDNGKVQQWIEGLVDPGEQSELGLSEDTMAG